ncbi:DNA-directed RNA polymerases IV and V subunit 2-like protein, partial [Tanacetum coccineum]
MYFATKATKILLVLQSKVVSGISSSIVPITEAVKLTTINESGASGTSVVPVDPSPSPLVSANQPLGTALVVSNHSPKSAAALSTPISVIYKSNLSHPSGTGQSVVKISATTKVYEASWKGKRILTNGFLKTLTMKDNLDDDGFPYDGARLNSGDIIIGKHAEEGADHSIKLKHGEKGSVQKVVLSANDDGKNFTTVSLRRVRIPSLGDNFSSMHGQKGVLEFLESQENFPFTIQGIVTDIVINPHAFPSRQTPGEPLEAALGKGIALGGSVEYVTSFSTPTI